MSNWNTSNSSYGAYYRSQSRVPNTNYQYPVATYQSPQTSSYTYQSLPEGLQNLGNTCYISAVLQILFPIISENILTLTSKSQQKITSFFLVLRNSKDTSDYRRFKDALEERVEMVRGWEQQDAHELMVHLIEELRKENPLPLKTGKVDLEYDEKRGFEQNWEKFTSQMLKLENSKIIYLFYGQILKEFVCPVKHTKHKFERFMGISLHFPPSSPHSSSYLLQGPIKLQDMIQSFLGHETINDLNCEQCKAKKSFSKASVFYSIPAYLIIHLSRFDKGWYSNHKNSRQVEFDQVLYLSQRIEKKATLRLLGVIHHLGSINRGHYFAQIRVGQQWFQMNDDKVSQTQMKQKGNVSATAYILVYQKK